MAEEQERKGEMLHRKPAWSCCVWVVSALAVVTCGCYGPLGYVLTVGVGELDLLCSIVPIEDALDDPALTEEEREKIAIVIRARDYAEQVVGLNTTGSFHGFVNLYGEPLAWNVSACPKDAFEPYTWPIPLSPPTPYLGYFRQEQALAERDRLVAAGYDTFVYEVDAYALSFLPDPVFSPVLRRDVPSLVDTVIHELLHNTIMRLGATTFNESLAVFVARTASIEFFESEYGPDAPIVEQARQGYEDDDRFNAFLVELMAELNTIYDTDEPYEVKLEKRERVFESARQRFAAEILPLMHDPAPFGIYTDFPYNNAFLLVNERYNSDLDLYEGIYEMTGRDWPQALAVFGQAAASAGDPVSFLRDTLAEHTSVP